MSMKALRNYLTGYTEVTTRTMLEHLYSTYGDITENILRKIIKKINTPYDPNQPFGNLVEQINQATELVDAAKAPYIVPKIVSIGYNLNHQIGISTLECQSWDEKSTADKRWKNCSFAQYWRRSNNTTHQTGYHEANMTTEEILSALDNMAIVLE